MIRAVIFDLGGVVLDFLNTSYYKHLASMHGIPESRVRKIVEDRYLDLLEEGRISTDSFERRIAGALGIKKSKVGWYDFYKKSAYVNIDVLELVKMLHRDYITAFLSNTDISRYTYTKKILDLDAFDYRITSCYARLRKPDPRIYRYALERIGVDAGQTLFIDNMLENVVAARKVGMASVHFVNRRLLDRELARLSI